MKCEKKNRREIRGQIREVKKREGDLAVFGD
jgi:hypothetical protein